MAFDGNDDSGGSNSVDEGVGSAFGRVISALKTNADGETIKEGTKILEEGFASVARNMGLTSASSPAIKKTLEDAYADAAAIGATFQDAVDAQEAITKTTGRNLIMSSDYLKDIKMAADISGSSIKDLTEGFINAGYNMHNIADEMELLDPASKDYTELDFEFNHTSGQALMLSHLLTKIEE